jgi:hypothetical protein
LTIAVGKRDKSAVSDAAKMRLSLAPEQIQPKATVKLTPKPRSHK